jgi:hypothetical protein
MGEENSGEEIFASFIAALSRDASISVVAPSF